MFIFAAKQEVMIQQDFSFFKTNRQQLAKSYPDMYLIIKDQRVLFAVSTLAEAIDKAKEKGLVDGTYLMQFCDKEGKGMVCTYRSRAHFAK